MAELGPLGLFGWSLKASQASGPIYLPDLLCHKECKTESIQRHTRKSPGHPREPDVIRKPKVTLQSKPSAYICRSSWFPSSQAPALSFHLRLNNLRGKKKKNYSSSKRFWEALDNLASGEYISWPLSLGNQIHLLGVGVESPLSFPCQCLFLDLHAWAQAEFPVNNCLGGREAV